MTEDDSDGRNDEPGMTLEQILQRQMMKSGITSPALSLVDKYREKLDDLGDLLGKSQTAPVEPHTLLTASKALDNLQCEFRLEYNLSALPFERHAMAGLIDEMIALLEKSDISFPHKEKILSNSRDRLEIIRSGKERDFLS